MRVDDTLFPRADERHRLEGELPARRRGAGAGSRRRRPQRDGHRARRRRHLRQRAQAPGHRRLLDGPRQGARGSLDHRQRDVARPSAPSPREFINTSNNDYAENLHRHSSLTAGKGATWAAANGHALAVLKAGGSTPGCGDPRRLGPVALGPDECRVDGQRPLPRRRDRGRQRRCSTAPTGMPTAGVSGTLEDPLRHRRHPLRPGQGAGQDGMAQRRRRALGHGLRRGRPAADLLDHRERRGRTPREARLAIERFATAATGCNPA